MSLLAMSFGDRFCFSKNGGIRGGGWEQPKAWLHLGSSVEMTWLALRGPFLSFFGINGVRNKRSHLVGPPFRAHQSPLFSYSKLAFLESLNWKFVNSLGSEFSSQSHFHTL